jgi:peptide chain release factor subunit 1
VEKEKYQLKQLIKFLEGVRGRHTELVTVYIPAGYNINLIINHLQEEAGTASNIKSKTVRTNVTTAIEKMITELRHYKQTPKNGLALFSGNISEVEGKPDYRVWTIMPPEPINNRLYRCDQTFILGPLKDITESKTVFGLLVMELREASIAMLKGSSVLPVKELESRVMGKFKAGGQSAARFSRIREGQVKDWMKKVSAMMNQIFRGKEISGILVGGPGPAKDDFVSNYLSEELKKKVIAIQDIGYTGEQGLKELVAKSEQILEKEEIIAEKKLMNTFLAHLAKDDGFSSYGEAEVWKNLENGAVEILLMSESLSEEQVEKFSSKAEEFGTKIHLISVDFQEGMQLKELGGFAAILRYKM